MHQLPAHLPGFIQAIAPTVDKYGYLAVAGLVMIEDFGIPVPGETTLIAAAVFAGIGKLNILLVILIAFVAAAIGDNIGFAIGDLGGRPLVERFGRYVFLTPDRLDKAEAFFNRHGPKVVTVARFIEGLRQLNGIIAGLSDMKWPTFIIFNAIGALLWATFWSGVGYYGGSHIAAIVHYQLYFTVAVVALIILYIIFKIAKRKSKYRASNYGK